MFNLKRVTDYKTRFWSRVFPVIVVIFILSGFAVVLVNGPWLISLGPAGGGALLFLLLLACVPAALAIWLAWALVTQFIQSFYQLESREAASGFLTRQLFGQPDFKPFARIEGGKVAFGEEVVEKIGGPGSLIVYGDSAVILQRAGVLTRVEPGPAFVSLEPFEKVWDIIDLRPQRWVFEVKAITYDGIPIAYEADVQFQIAHADLGPAPEEEKQAKRELLKKAVFEAAKSQWVRDANRTEPDRRMIWTKRVIISHTEGGFRSILARYRLDELLEVATRAKLQSQLLAHLIRETADMGVKILRVELGDIKLEGDIPKQWLDLWRARKTREMNVEISKGFAERTRYLEEARAQVRSQILRQTATELRNVAGENEKLRSRLIIISCIEVLKRTALNFTFFRPKDIIETLDAVRASIECDKGEAPEAPVEE